MLKTKPMKKTNLRQLLIISLILISSIVVKAQNDGSFQELQQFTSQDDFFVNNLYDVWSKHFSDDGSIKLLVEGNISDPNFSFALVSMLPSLKNRRIYEYEIDFLYTQLNDENFEEALVIDAIKKIYPDKFFEYLISRSNSIFQNDWQQVALDNSMNLNDIENYYNNPINKADVLQKFSSRLSDIDYRIFRNEREFNLIPSFFQGGGTVVINNSIVGEQNVSICCTQATCLSNCIHDFLQFAVSKGYISDAVFEAGSFTNPSDIHAVLLGCATTIVSGGVAAYQGGSNTIVDGIFAINAMKCLQGILKIEGYSLTDEQLANWNICP